MSGSCVLPCPYLCPKGPSHRPPALACGPAVQVLSTFSVMVTARRLIIAARQAAASTGTMRLGVPGASELGPPRYRAARRPQRSHDAEKSHTRTPPNLAGILLHAGRGQNLAFDRNTPPRQGRLPLCGCPVGLWQPGHPHSGKSPLWKGEARGWARPPAVACSCSGGPIPGRQGCTEHGASPANYFKLCCWG